MSDDGVMADAPHPGGRPSKFEPQFCERARALAEKGATDKEIADDLGVHIATFYRWQAQFPEFCEALKAGKAPADERVERTLFHRAVGYTFETEEIRVLHDGTVVRVPVVEHIAPDTTAAIFWLKNRRPNEWRDRREQVLTGPDGGAIQVVTGVPRAETEPQS